MKKFFTKTIIISIVALAILFFVSDVREELYVDPDLLKSAEYTSNYYYNQLNEEQKLMYIKIDKKVEGLSNTIHLGFIKNVKAKKDVETILTAIYNDSPEYYYLPQDYNVKSFKFGPIEYTMLRLSYTVKDESEKNIKDDRLNQVITAMVYDNTTEDMSDFEKVLNLHDALIAKVKYYEFEKIEEIPVAKHTAYEALVNESAVCDGITKAFMLLLEKVGIETIMITGTMSDVAHAWNIVKIDDEYYHIDVTSDTVELGGKQHIVHRYFNLSDEEIKRTHEIDDDFKVIECNGTKYEYYTYKDYYVDYSEDLRRKLVEIINEQYESSVVEFKISELYSSQSLLEELYFLDFNNWETENKDVVKYHKIEEVYVFENTNKKRVY